MANGAGQGHTSGHWLWAGRHGGIGSKQAYSLFMVKGLILMLGEEGDHIIFSTYKVQCNVGFLTIGRVPTAQIIKLPVHPRVTLLFKNVYLNGSIKNYNLSSRVQYDGTCIHYKASDQSASYSQDIETERDLKK